MGLPESSSIIDTLPVWMQVIANIGVLAVAMIAAFYGFIRRISAISHVGEGFPDPVAAFTNNAIATRELTAVMSEMAATAKATLILLQEHERHAEIEREVARRLAERIPREDN
jgi:hypothetical protein